MTPAKPIDPLDLESAGIPHSQHIRRNLPTPLLIEEIVKNREGRMAHLGPVVVRTGNHIERTPDDRFLVEDARAAGASWRNRHRFVSEEHFQGLLDRLLAYLQDKELYVQDCHAGSHPEHRVPLRIVTETAWHSLFARTMYHQIHDSTELDDFRPAFSVIYAPGFQAIPDRDGTGSTAFSITHLRRRLILLGGTSYGGEIKHAVFTAIDACTPPERVLPVRCAVNVGPQGDVAVFLGRSGAGKTSLGTDPGRALVGDDQHGWTDEGLFAFEWGCYARGLHLAPEAEPLIHACTRRFGTLLENVSMDPDTRRLDLEDARLTDNARIVYPVSHLPGALREGRCGHPANLFMLTRDPYGVLPPIARLTHEQALFALLSSYTPELAEADPEVRVARVLHSACFGACPVMLHPREYAQLFWNRIQKHDVRCWLLNTGWAGEPRGRGERVALNVSRTLVHAALNGFLDDVEVRVDPVFQFGVPASCPGLEADLLDPRLLASDEGEYEVRANRLATDFLQDFDQFIEDVPGSVREMLSQIVLLEDSLDVMERFRFTI